MDADFWLARWREEQTGFHQQRVTPLLMKYWPTLGLPEGCRVLVPLCGKSLDMIWLAEQGHEVLGVELAQQPIEQFFAENNLQTTVRESAEGIHYRSGNIELICGDIFGIRVATLSICQGGANVSALRCGQGDRADVVDVADDQLETSAARVDACSRFAQRRLPDVVG